MYSPPTTPLNPIVMPEEHTKAPRKALVVDSSFGRRSEAEAGTHLTAERISEFFHLPVHEAAVHLGVAVRVLRAFCLSLGVAHWPYRRLQMLDEMIASIRWDPAKVEMISRLYQTRARVCRDPATPLPADVQRFVERFVEERREEELNRRRRASPVSRAHLKRVIATIKGFQEKKEAAQPT